MNLDNEKIPRTETTGRIFAYKSKTFRNATIGEEYPKTFLDGELDHYDLFVAKRCNRVQHT